MTSKDFIDAENGNTGKIILYREGLFWKASIELVSHLNNSNTADIKQSSAMILVERVSSFDLASSTPMDCMFFITELKKLLTS